VRKLIAALARGVAPGYGYCQQCRWPWKFREEHVVRLGNSTGFFFLCEKCWDETTPAVRAILCAAAFRSLGRDESTIRRYQLLTVNGPGASTEEPTP
jgi:hypothetical protein